MEQEEVERLFGNAGRNITKILGNNQYHTDEEWNKIGVKLFKRRVLGFCGDKIEFVSLDELASVLYNNHMINSRDEAMKLIPELIGHTFDYGNGNYLRFESVRSAKGSAGCRIVKVAYD